MTARLYTYAATALVAAAVAATGAWQVQAWRYGAKEAQRLEQERQADELRQADAHQQRQFIDQAAGKHAAALAHLNKQLGDARAHIATLSRDRQCFGADTVGVLNAIGKPYAGDVRATAGQPDGAAGASAGSATDSPGAAGYASERDTAEFIATCRKQYGEVSGQLIQIQEIERRRHAGLAGQ